MLYVTAIRRPVKNDGRAEGRRTIRQMCLLFAPMLRSRAISSGSADAKPSAVLIVSGKKQKSTTMETVGAIPKPNQMTRMGAMASICMVCDTTSMG